MDLVPPSISLEGLTFDSAALEKISAGLAYRNKVFPVRLEENILTVAMADPHDVILIDETISGGGKKQPLFLKWLLVNCFADFK